jgi:hypothetical protein
MDETTIPWSRVAAFVRQHTHDVRNGLNSLELETAYLQELVTDSEAVESVGRVRKQLRTVAQQLRTLSASFQDPAPLAANLPARALLKIWREKLAALPQGPEVQWVDELGEEEVSVDVEMMAAAFRELLMNAAVYTPGTPLTISARTTGGEVVFELREPKTAAVDTGTWGQPLNSSRRDHYGLGLWTVRQMMASCGIAFTQRYAAAENCLISRIVLPVV